MVALLGGPFPAAIMWPAPVGISDKSEFALLPSVIQPFPLRFTIRLETA